MCPLQSTTRNKVQVFIEDSYGHGATTWAWIDFPIDKTICLDIYKAEAIDNVKKITILSDSIV